MQNTCPSCGAPDYGTPFCISCQGPMPRGQAAPSAGPGPAAESAPTLPLAGIFPRFVALMTDYLIVGILADLLQMAHSLGTGQKEPTIELDAALGISLVLLLLYFTLFLGDGGQTLGKRLLGVKVVRADGVEIGYGRAFLRAVGYWASSSVLGLGFLWALWDRRKQAWHDKIAGTVVIRT